jgi:predicted metalloprotease with PDZ domain
MREVNLNLFDFDYDLTWMGFFVSPREKVYGRYGGRDAGPADGRVSMAGLCCALEAALKRHKAEPRAGNPSVAPRPSRTVAEYPAFRRLPANACVHCHQVYDLRRESLQAAGKWSLDEVWVYPQPENIGLTLDVDRGDHVTAVAPDSPAARAGVRAGDRIALVNGVPVSSIADLQYGLHRAGPARSLEIVRQRDGKEETTTLELPADWRKTDVSWRWSLRGLDPMPPVRGDDLSAAEKVSLGLSPKRLAFRQGPFVTPAAEAAGIHQNDVVIGVDGKELEMNERQFGAYVRLSYKVGDRLTLNLLRGGRRVDVAVVLAGRASS